MDEAIDQSIYATGLMITPVSGTFPNLLKQFDLAASKYQALESTMSIGLPGVPAIVTGAMAEITHTLVADIGTMTACYRTKKPDDCVEAANTVKRDQGELGAALGGLVPYGSRSPEEVMFELGSQSQRPTPQTS